MTLRVPLYPPRITETGNTYRAAAPVRGDAQWYGLARANNWLYGCGGALAFCGPSGSAITPGATGDTTWRRFWVWPRNGAGGVYQNTTWFFALQLRSSSANGAEGTVQVGVSGLQETFDFELPDDKSRIFHFVHVPPVSPEGEAIARVLPSADSAGNVTIETVSIHELPRVVLYSNASRAGVHETSCKRGTPIYENTGTSIKYSAQAVWAQMHAAPTYNRRSCVFGWFHPDGITSTSTAETGTGNIIVMSPAFQSRLLTNAASTVRELNWNIYAKVTGASAVGIVKISMTNSETDNFVVTSTTAQWHTARTINVTTDDMTEADLIRGGTRDEALFECWKTAGTSVTVYGISVGESE